MYWTTFYCNNSDQYLYIIILYISGFPALEAGHWASNQCRGLIADFEKGKLNMMYLTYSYRYINFYLKFSLIWMYNDTNDIFYWLIQVSYVNMRLIFMSVQSTQEEMLL